MSNTNTININNTSNLDGKMVYTNPLEGYMLEVGFKLFDVISSIWHPLFVHLNDTSDGLPINMLMIDIIMSLINVNNLLEKHTNTRCDQSTNRFGIYDVSTIITSAVEAQENNWGKTIKLFNELMHSSINVQLNFIELWMIIYQNIV